MIYIIMICVGVQPKLMMCAGNNETQEKLVRRLNQQVKEYEMKRAAVRQIEETYERKRKMLESAAERSKKHIDIAGMQAQKRIQRMFEIELERIDLEASMIYTYHDPKDILQSPPKVPTMLVTGNADEMRILHDNRYTLWLHAYFIIFLHLFVFFPR